MKLKIFRALWGGGDDHAASAAAARDAGFDGLEGGLPTDLGGVRALASALAAHGLDYIAEICTGGSNGAYWIPARRASVEDHLRSVEDGLQRLAASGIEPLFVNCMGGLDAWPIAASIDFFGRAMALGAAHGVTLSFETHRARSMFSPWSTQAIVEALPDILITCDFSHWCVVAERLIDDEVEALTTVCPRAFHIQCRVGYEQGPQVPHPAAPEYRYALEAHQRWWEMAWTARRACGQRTLTMTPEFGPNGYLQAAPFSGKPAGDLWEINRWMAETERAHFADWLAASASPVPEDAAGAADR
jgi:sugar phosphate isomerase/epimerase